MNMSRSRVFSRVFSSVLSRVFSRVHSRVLRRSPRSALRGACVLALGTLLGTTLACDTPTLARPLAAYDPTMLTGGQLYRWPSGSRVRYYIVPPADSTLDLRTAAQTAASVWNQLPMFKEFKLEPAASLAEANLVVLDRPSPLPVAPAAVCAYAPGNSKGYTYFCPQGGQAVKLALTSGGNSTVSVIVSVDVGALANQTELETILAHEFGHALGIGAHSPNSRDLMFGAPTVSVPSIRDAQTLQFLLGERPAFTL